MPRNGSGTYSLPAGNPVVAGTTIEASWANATLNDVATEMTGSLARSGSGGMTGPLRLDAGTAAVPALAWSTETATGLYRAGTNDVRLAVATSDVMRWQAAGVSVTGTLGVSGAVTLSGGTANGVLYLDGSKVASSGSALTFDGTNLGVGTTSPGAKLDVSGADGVRARVVATAGGTSGLILSSAGNTAYTIKAGNADNSLRIDQDGTDRLTLASGGNLGIGTGSPGAKLEVYGGASGTVTNIQAGNAATAFVLGVDASNNCQVRTAQNVSMLFYTNATQRMQISADGNVFVGTAALATTATAGFPWIPSCPGIPTGAPTAPYTNAAAMVVDTTNNRLYVRVGSTWRYATLT